MTDDANMQRATPLTTEQLSHFETRLKEERAQAMDSINRATGTEAEGTAQERSGELTNMPFHQADLATDTIDQEIEMSNASRASRELAEIDAALERLYSHPESFGRCEKSGRDIPLERLEVIPWARTCIE